MKTALFLLCFFSLHYVSAQEDSISISIFITPLEEILISEQDSLILVDQPLFSEEELQYGYDFFVVGFDTLSTVSFTASFTTSSGEEISESFTIEEIDANPDIERYGDSVILPLGEFGYMDIYEYEISVYGENEELILSLSDFYDSQE